MAGKKGKHAAGKKERGGPWLAPGNEELMEMPPTPEEKRHGDYTVVTGLSYDEVDPGGRR